MLTFCKTKEIRNDKKKATNFRMNFITCFQSTLYLQIVLKPWLILVFAMEGCHRQTTATTTARVHTSPRLAQFRLALVRQYLRWEREREREREGGCTVWLLYTSRPPETLSSQLDYCPYWVGDHIRHNTLLREFR